MHIVPAVGGDPQDCPECGQTFNDQLVSFFIHRLSLLRDGFIDNTANFYWNRYGGAGQDSPAPMELSLIHISEPTRLHCIASLSLIHI